LCGALAAVLSLALPTVAQVADHQWAGLVFDAFTLDGQEVWTVERQIRSNRP
jgi:hypothetical protein